MNDTDRAAFRAWIVEQAAPDEDFHLVAMWRAWKAGLAHRDAEVASLKASLRELSAMYSHAWDRVDGALVMLPDSIPRFEAAHESARSLLSPTDYEAIEREHLGDAEKQTGIYAKAGGCSCETCRPITMTDMRMVVCETCGNKRCPHATDHRNACSGSNEPEQQGSSYAGRAPDTPPA